MSRLYVNGTIRSWLHYLDVRMEKGVTQKSMLFLLHLLQSRLTRHSRWRKQANMPDTTTTGAGAQLPTGKP